MSSDRGDVMRITELFGVELPVIQAPMAGVQDAALAAAVSNAGGLGSLPCASLGPDGLENELARLVGLTDKPFNVNFFCHRQPCEQARQMQAWVTKLAPYYEELGLEPPTTGQVGGRRPFDADAMAVMEQFRPAVVSFHFGLPDRQWVARIKSWGTRVISTATTVEEAAWLADRGVDAVIAQGIEAGGHRGSFLTADMTTQMGTLSLVPQILSAVDLPVIAAGGIASAGGVEAALALGAAGVQVGTAFLLCPEATTGKLHRAALASAASRHTALTNVFTGRPARGIVNRLVREVGPMSAAAPPFPTAAGALAGLRKAAEKQGRDDFTSMWCGQNATGCREITAAELLRSLSPGQRV
jgi:nitronate monooxygenase